MAAAGGLAITLLETSPALKILATSREPLGRPGEFRFPLTGLGMAAEAAWVGDAEQLFEQRASEVRPDLIHDDDMRLAVASICRHLDGMPLAIELAAARVDTMSPAEIDRHLSDRFSLLSDGRADRPATPVAPGLARLELQPPHPGRKEWLRLPRHLQRTVRRVGCAGR